MMMNVLLPTDFSDNSRNAAAYALRFFRNTPCNFYFLHVIEVPADKLGSAYLATSPELKLKFDQLLSWLETIKTNPLHHFHACFKADFLIHAVRNKVQEKNIDLILMGTKGQTNSVGAVIGKNTSDVMMKVKCPVLAISEKAVFRDYREILFPTDYKISYDSKLLHILSSLSALSQANIKILELFNTGVEPTAEQLLNRNLLREYFSPRVPISETWYTLQERNFKKLLASNRNTDMIVLAARNLRLCQQFLHNDQNNQIPFIHQLPLLVLHG